MARKVSKAAAGAAAATLVAGAAIASVPAASAGALAAASTAASAAVTAGTVTPASTPTWSAVSPPAVGGEVTAFATFQVGNANYQWAFQSTANEVPTGLPSVYTRVNNGSWAKTALPGSVGGERFVYAAALSPTDVVAFTKLAGAGGRQWQFNGTSWRVVKTFDAQIGDATVTSAGNMWVFGTDAAGGGDLGVYHYNGTTWTKLASTLLGGQGLSSGTTAYAYTGTTVAFYNGTKWVATSLASLLPAKTSTNDPHIAGIWDANGTIYAVGTGGAASAGGPVVLLISNGKTWKVAATAGTAGFPAPNQIANDGQNGVWFPVTQQDGTTTELFHYILSTRQLTATALPGTIGALHEIDLTHELAGGDARNTTSGSPATYAEIEYYN